MAFSVRIEAYHGVATTPMLYLEPSGWNQDELKKDDRFKYEPEMAGYDDYVAKLSPNDFRDVYHRYRSEMNKYYKECNGDDHPEVKMLDGLVDYLSADDHVIVTVFEWDSGF